LTLPDSSFSCRLRLLRPSNGRLLIVSSAFPQGFGLPPFDSSLLDLGTCPYTQPRVSRRRAEERVNGGGRAAASLWGTAGCHSARLVPRSRMRTSAPDADQSLGRPRTPTMIAAKTQKLQAFRAGKSTSTRTNHSVD
jgi:hypothetical protein